MAGSLLGSLVNGTRQVLAVQLIVSIAAIALAGWTLGVTTELVRERDRLRNRVIQLEQVMGGSGIVVPESPAVVDEPAPARDENAYPGAIGLAEPRVAARSAERGDTSTAGERAEQGRLSGLFGSLFAPAPSMHVIVLHVRADGDRREADTVATALRQTGYDVHIRVMAPRDPRESGYVYFDGRQSSAAADLVNRFQDVARENQIAPWTAQLRGVALPAQGEYAADRLDLVLPPLPAQAPPPPPTP